MTTTRKERMLGTPSRSVLRLIPERVVVFLSGIALNPGIRAALEGGGYDKQAHDEGAKLLEALCSLPTDSAPSDEGRARAAQLEIATWVKSNFARLRAAIGRMDPEQASLFDGIEAPAANEAAAALAKLIERVNALPAEPAGARQTLEERGFDGAEQNRLSGLIELARKHSRPSAKKASAAPEPELIELYKWHCDWATTARAFIKRRDWLEAIGLAGRKRRRDAEFFGEEATPDQAESAVEE